MCAAHSLHNMGYQCSLHFCRTHMQLLADSQQLPCPRYCTYCKILQFLSTCMPSTIRLPPYIHYFSLSLSCNSDLLSHLQFCNYALLFILYPLWCEQQQRWTDNTVQLAVPLLLPALTFKHIKSLYTGSISLST